MKRDLPRYVYRRGAYRHVYYCRAGSRAIRMHSEPGSPEFAMEYAGLLAGRTPAQKARTFAALIDRYRASQAFTRLKPRTQADYDLVLNFIAERMGPLDPARMKPHHVYRMQSDNAERVRFARYCVQVMRPLLQHGIELGWLQTNVARDVKLLAMPEAKKAPHEPWTDEAVAKFRAEASPKARLILELGIGTTQRPADLVRFNWEDFDGECLRLTQGKTGKAMVLPCTDRLKAALAETPRPSVVRIGGTPILTGARNARMTYRAMSQLMLDERKRLGLQRFDLHALRYRGIMELAWAGCDDDEIAGYSGHESKAMILKYAGKARQVMRARQAKGKRG